jgi:glycine cleavage system aminomethyltransferase T
MAKIHAIIARSDWGSLTAYRLLVARDVGEYAWDVLWEAGHDLGLAPIGRAAERILRAGVAQCISS